MSEQKEMPPERIWVRGQSNGALGLWHDATSSRETATIANEGGGTRNPFYAYILATPTALAADPAVKALVVEEAAKIATRHWEGEPEDTLAMEAEIRALAPADGLAEVQALRVEARENAMQALASMGQAQEAYEAQLEAEAELAVAQQREAALSDPICVHVNMLRGTIAKPTLEQIIHLYGVDALCKALMPVIVREAEAAIIRKGGTL